MSEANKIDYTGIVNAARKGDEEAYELLYNESVRKCRAICMKYFDPATAEGRRKTSEVVREVYVKMYDRVGTLYDPDDFPILGRSVTREICLKKAKGETVQLHAESYIGVSEGLETEVPLVTAETVRGEVRSEAMLSDETIGTLVLSVLHAMNPAQRLAIVRWNEDDAGAMKHPDVLREAFICTEKTIMELEPVCGIRAKDFAKSRLAFFCRLLDLYNRFYEASSRDWNDALEPAYALKLSGDVPAVSEEAVSFHSIWEEIRSQFYITNTIRLPKILPGEEAFSGYLDEEGAAEEDGDESPEAAVPEERPAKKRGFLGTWWGRLIVGLVIIVLVLVAVVATAGQHTSHAMGPAFMQYADSVFEQSYGFNIS